MESSAQPGGLLRSDSVAYAVWLMGQGPRISGQQAQGLIARRYPELTLGEIEHVQTQAESQVAAGFALMALVAGERLDDSQIPDSGQGGTSYRIQVDATIPTSSGGFAHRTVVVESDESPTSDAVVNEIVEAVRGICGETPDSQRDRCLEWLLGEISITNASLSRGHL